MKQIFYIGLLFISFNLSAQTEQFDWLTDFKTAIKTANEQNKPVLAFAIDGQQSGEMKLLDGEFFSSEVVKSMKDKAVFLKLNINEDIYAKRMAIHFTDSNTGPALALIQANQKPIGDPLNKINSNTISSYILFLKSQFQ